MKFKATFTSLCFSVLSIASFNAHSETIFEDSFETSNLSTTNSEGFKWRSANRTSIVIQDPSDGPVAVWNNKTIYNIHPDIYGDGTPRYWTPKTGTHSMRFRYSAGQNMAEQRFDMGGSYSDIWLRYWLRVPTNYSHGKSSPSNHKFFALWMDAYSSKGNGPTVAWEFWGNGNGGSNLAFHYGEGGYKIMGGHKQHTPFISYPTDQGRWMQVVLHVKAATNSNSNDGVIQMWRRWQNEANFTNFHDTKSANIAAPSGGPYGWAAGYIMGWANAPYSNDTEWLLDDFTISDQPLVVAPMPPSSYIVQ